MYSQRRATRSALSTLFLAFAMLFGAADAWSALTYSWTGATGNGKWSSSGNWNPAGVPTTGDTLAFPAGVANTTAVNDLPAGTSFAALGLLGTGYAISGNGIVVTTSVSSVYYNQPLALPIDFQANNVSITGGQIRFTGGLAGSGTITLSTSTQLEGAGTFSGTITSGTTYQQLTLANSASYPNARVAGNIALIGNGTIGTYAATTTLQPNGGVLNTADATISSYVYAPINGTTPGTGYPQVSVHGVLTLAAGSSLGVSFGAGYVPVAGQVFTMFANDGTDAVAGTFSGTPEGSAYSGNGANLRLSYVGGDGNDITLTVTTAPRAWTGASSTLWSDANNWSPAGVPQAGERLLFPSGAANLASTNDINGLSVFQLVITGSNYTLSGNPLAVTGLVDGGNGSGNRIALPLDFGTAPVGINGTGALPGLRITGGISGTNAITSYATFQLEGASSFSGTFYSGGTLTLANGASMPNATLTVGGTLIGNGTLGALTSQYLQPNGILATRNLTQNGIVTVSLSGSTAGTGYPQVQPTGTVTLGTNARLTVTHAAGFSPVVGQEYVLFANDGADAVTGTFSGLPEGGTISVNGADYRVSYRGGDGNDISITSTVVPRIWTGAASNLWSDAANWSPNGVPQAGERLQFPSGAAHLANTNDLAAGTSFNSLSFVGPNYTIGGNAIVLTAGIQSPSPATGIVLALPVDFQANNVALDGNNGNRLRFTGGIAGTGTIAVNTYIQVEGANSFSGTFTSASGYNVYAVGGSSLAAASFGGSASFSGYSTTIGNFNSNGAFQQVGGFVGTGNFAPNGSFYSYINGAGAGTGYSQVQSTGTVALGANATLQTSLSTSFVPSVGASYVLIANDGTDAITGTFSGLAEGSTLTLNGVYQFRVTYAGGDGNDFALVSLNGKPASTTSLATSASPANAATPVTFTATVSGAALPPTGTVTFYDGATAIGAATLSSGTATFTTSSLAAGSHNITASYPGDSSYGGSASATVVQVIQKWASATAVTASANPAEFASALTLTANVTSAGGTPTGTVHFLDGATEIGTGTLSAGRATFTTSTLSRGSHTITANYDGSGVFNTSSGTMSVTLVVQDTTKPQVAITGNPPALTTATSVTFAFTASDASGIASVSCTMDTATITNCTSPQVYTVAQGNHVFTVAATDGAGNSDSRSWTFTVDTTGPAVTIGTLPTITRANQAGYGFGGACETGGTSVTYTLTLGSVVTGSVACSGGAYTVSGLDVSALADGNVAVQVGQSDAAGNGNTATGSARKSTTSKHAYHVDFNGDGKGDLSWSDGRGTHGLWLMNGGTAGSAGGVTGPAGANVIQLADFDGDGKSDLLWLGTGGDVHLSLMNGLAIVSTAKVFDGGNGWAVVGVGDFNGDGKADLLWKHPVQGYGIWLMNGQAVLQVAAIAAPGAGFDVALLDDFNGDGRTDLVWTHSDGRAAISLMNGVTASVTTQVLGAGTGWSPILTGDLDGDGKADLVWTHADGSHGAWLMDGTAVASASGLRNAGSGWKAKLVRDFDGDGRGDILWESTDGRGAYESWLMAGTTATQTRRIYDGGGWFVVASDDYDADGKDDLLWRSTSGEHGTWLMDGLTTRSAASVLPANTGWEISPR